MIKKWDKNIEMAVDKAEMYDAKASIVAFIIFFLGALAAFFGGATGSPLLTVSEERREDKFD
jgi:hypothetical protein